MSRIARILTLILIVAAALPTQFARAQDPGTGPYAEAGVLGRGMLRSVAWSPQGDVVAAGGALGIWLYGPDLADGGLLRGHTKAVYGLAFSPDGSRLASVSHDMTVRVWDVAAQAEIHTLTGHTGLTVAVAWQPGAAVIASGAYDGTIRLWDAESGASRRVIETGAGWVSGLAFSPDGAQIASAQGDGSVRVWDAATGEAITTLRGHTGTVLSVAWSDDGRTVASGGRDGQVILWDMANGSVLRALAVEDGPITAVAWRPGAASLAVVVGDARVGVIAPGDAVGEAIAPSWLPIRADRVAWNAAGGQIVTAAWNGGVAVWDAVSGARLFARDEHTDWITGLAWDADGLRSASADGWVRAWDGASGALLAAASGNVPDGPLEAASPDGARIAQADDAGVTVTDAASGAIIAVLPGAANAVVWSPDGRQIAVALRNGTIKLWGEQ